MMVLLSLLVMDILLFLPDVGTLIYKSLFIKYLNI
jgi:hypothetical protein